MVKLQEQRDKVKTYISSNTAVTLITYNGYIFKVDKNLKIINNLEESTDEIIAKGGKYIYNRGEISQEAKSFIGEKDINSEYSFKDDNIYMNIIQNEYNSTFVRTESKINLTGYTKIKCLVSTGEGLENSANKFHLRIKDTQEKDNCYDSVAIGANQKDYLLEFEIPDEYFNKEVYIGAVGTLKDIHIYKIWLEKSETKMLYDYGKVSPEVKGFVGISNINASHAINEKNLYMTAVDVANGCNNSYIGTENKIDLTDYNKIRCLVSTGNNLVNSINIFCLAIHNEQLASDYAYKTSKTIGAKQTHYYLSFDIPDECKNSDFYVGVWNCIQDVYVYQLWLEK